MENLIDLAVPIVAGGMLIVMTEKLFGEPEAKVEKWEESNWKKAKSLSELL